MKKNNRRSLPAPPINIYDQFLIVGLRPDTLGPIVLSSYPSQKPASPNVALFCFPEDITHENVNKLRMGASFFFVLTDEVGRQQVGFTRRTGKGKDMVSLCMLTHRDSSWMYTFNCLLEECEGRYKSNAGQLEPFLASLYVAPVPDPGNDIVLTYANGTNPLTLLYTRPVPCPDTTDTALFGVTMLPLLANLTTTPILQLFASLLFERRTILVSSSLERVSACVQAAVSALFPFAWHHIFIPVLPLSLVDYCSAPMPFVIGLHSSLLLSLQKMPMSEVVLVDLDRDQVSAVAGDLALLPQSLLGPLKTVLDAATADFHRITSTSKSTLDWMRVAEAFRHFFVRVFHSYAKFFVQKPGADVVKFDKEAFIQAQPKQIRKFLETFCASQMFERFIAEREIGKQNDDMLFENEIKLYEVSQAHAGLGVQLQDKAKKSVERLSNIGATLRTHLENPFMYRRDNEPPAAAKPTQPTLHPSLVRGQQVPTEPPRRTTKPLPPIPPGATPAATSAFPPNIPVGDAPALVWDDVNDQTDTLKPAYAAGRPKSATVTSTTPASNPTGTTPPVLNHSNSSSNILLAATPLPTNTNIFQFSPFEVDITPATPAPSISNSIMSSSGAVPAWFSPDSVGNNGEPAKPFFASSLPPVSMKPLNPFDESANAHAASDLQPTHPEPNNIFTSFSLDALAPPDNAHTSGSSYAPSSSFGVGPPAHYGSSPGGYFNPGTVGGFGSPTTSSSGGGTVPNMANVSSGGGTVPNMLNASGGIAQSGGTIPNMQHASSGGMPNMQNTSSGGIPNMLNTSGGIPNVQSGGTVPNYGNAAPNYGPNGLPVTASVRGDGFDSFLAERNSSPGIPAIQVSSPILANAPPTTAPTPIPIANSSSKSADEFDSFLAARMSQL